MTQRQKTSGAKVHKLKSYTQKSFA